MKGLMLAQRQGGRRWRDQFQGKEEDSLEPQMVLPFYYQTQNMNETEIPGTCRRVLRSRDDHRRRKKTGYQLWVISKLGIKSEHRSATWALRVE